MRARIFLLPASALCLCVFHSPAVAQGWYIEAESVTVNSPWKKATAVSGYTGSCYLQWTGGDQTGKPNLGAMLAFEFNVTKPGFYHVQVRGRRDRVDECAGAAGDLCNDLFSKMNNTSWRKTMVDGAWGTWIWMGRLYYDGSNHTAIFQLNEGKNTYYVTGRSKGVKLDAVRIYYEKTTPPGPGSTSSTSPVPARTLRTAAALRGQTRLYNILGQQIGRSNDPACTRHLTAGRRDLVIGPGGNHIVVVGP